MTLLENKTVLITGAAGGFGREMIRQFVQAGSYIIAADRDRTMLHDATATVAAALKSSKVRGKILGYVTGDLATDEGCDDVHRQAQSISSQIDILINNAGLGYSGPFTAIPPDHWERLMQVNLLAPMRLTSRILPNMIAQRSGHIANISSVAGLIGVPGLAAYSTSKWGLRGFSEALANEVGVFNIGVTTIYPYFARTPILDSPQFGNKRQTLPDWMLYDPHFVVAALLEGIRKGRRHVYPGMLPKVMHTIQRLAPWAVPKLTQTMNPNRQA